MDSKDLVFDWGIVFKTVRNQKVTANSIFTQKYTSKIRYLAMLNLLDIIRRFQ